MWNIIPHRPAGLCVVESNLCFINFFSWRKLLWTVNVTSMETATRKLKARDCLFGIIWPRHTTYTTSSLMAMCCIRKRRWLRGSKNSDNDLTPIVWIFLVCFVNYLLSVSWSGTLAIFVIVVHARTCWRRHMADEIDGCVVMRFNGTCFCICRYIYHRKPRAKELSPTLFSMGYLTRGVLLVHSILHLTLKSVHCMWAR